jgi:hypothetical protein
MSSHFNYEIEERNMRNQLKALELSFKDDAWHSYEAYAKQFQSTHKAQLIPNFNFALNRTVVLPVVFGVIIVLFSFLLFNFINIKNAKQPKKEVSEVKATPVQSNSVKQKPEQKKEVVAPIKKEEAPKSEIQAATNSVAIVPVNSSNSAVAKTSPTAVNNLVAAAVVTNTVAQNAQITKSIPTYTFEPKKKKHKKRSVEVLESIATPISLPTVTQEEAEPELR